MFGVSGLVFEVLGFQFYFWVRVLGAGFLGGVVWLVGFTYTLVLNIFSFNSF